MTLIKTLSLGTIATLTLSASLNAASIALYDFETGTGNLASNDSTSVTSTDLVVGAGLTTHSIDNFDNGGGDSAGNPGFGARSTASNWGSGDTTVFDDDFYSFSVSPTGGGTLNFINFTIDINNDRNRADDTNYVGAGLEFYLYSSLVDGTLDSAADLVDTFTAPQTVGTFWVTYSIDLSAYTDVSGTTDFRLVLNSGAGNSQAFAWYDNLTVNADINPVPEPSSLMLLGLGGLALSVRRRRL